MLLHYMRSSTFRKNLIQMLGLKTSREMFETILSGVLVFVSGQIFLKMVLDPVNELKKSFADVAHGFLVNAPFIYKPGALNEEQKQIVSVRLLSLSGKLQANLQLVPLYGFWGHIFFMPTAKDIRDAAQYLVAINNWLHSGNEGALLHIMRYYQDTAARLGIYVPPNEQVSKELLNAAICSSFGHD